MFVSLVAKTKCSGQKIKEEVQEDCKPLLGYKSYRLDLEMYKGQREIELALERLELLIEILMFHTRNYSQHIVIDIGAYTT